MRGHVEPAYLALLRAGELEERARIAHDHLASCTLCPRECGANRLAGEFGSCHTGERAVLASFHAHFGEERPLVGSGGSGTIFFSHCNLKCVFCQNHDISQAGHGQEVDAHQLAGIMLHLQAAGCHNVNLVSPSHVVPQILSALVIAAEEGLRIPLVYNTGGYDAIETLRLLDGIIDIYMPDMKYSDEKIGRDFSDIPSYPVVNQAAVLEMHSQVGDLKISADGVAERGLLIRHLVLPNGLAGSHQILRFIAEMISVDTYLNIMDQFRPAYQAYRENDLNRRITRTEYQDILHFAESLGMTRLD